MPFADTVRSEPSTAEKAYRKLLRILRAVTGMFALIPVESELDDEETERWLEKLRCDLAAEGTTLWIAELSKERWDPIDAIERSWNNDREPAVILLRGLEKTPARPAAGSGSRPPAYARLNIDRESIEQLFPAPLILWCTPSSYEALGDHAPDFFDHFTGLVHFTRRRYRSMALPPKEFIHRRELDEIVDLLRRSRAERVATVALTTALRGAGGFGKTTLAQALSYDERVRSSFPDGVLWVTMGQDLRDADRLQRIRDLIRFWAGAEPPAFETLGSAAAYLREMLVGQRVLLVIDDVWTPADVEPFRGLSPSATLLVTTRDRRTLPPDTHRVDVDAMRRVEAVELLSWGLPSFDTTKLANLSARLGEWPLLLRLVNRQLRHLCQERRLSFDQALHKIEQRLGKGLTAFDLPDSQIREDAVRRTLEVSLRLLSEEDQKRFMTLAIFPEDTAVPIDVLQRVWSLSRRATRTLCFLLRDLSLLLDFDPQTGTIRLHDVVRGYLTSESPIEISKLHRRFLENCRPASGHWSDLSNAEGYLWHHLPYHLVAADHSAVLRGLLLDFSYLRAKLEATEISALLTDYGALPKDVELTAVRGALDLASHILARDSRQLASQLKGRLGDRTEPSLRRLLRQIDAWRNGGWLRPRTASLSSPGGFLIRTLAGHRHGFDDVAVIDAQRIVSASQDHTLRLWDLVSGESVRKFEGHASARAIAVIDESRFLSASSDTTLRLWDLKSGKNLRTLEGHTDWVTAIGVIDEHRAVSASYDETLRLWNLDTGEALATLKGHSAWVSAVAVIDSRRVVSASADTTLRLWDLDSGETLRTFEGHRDRVHAVATIDSSHIVTASADATLRIWNLDSGDLLRTLEGHSHQVTAVAVIDEQRIVSASRDRTLRIWDLNTGKILPRGIR